MSCLERFWFFTRIGGCLELSRPCPPTRRSFGSSVSLKKKRLRDAKVKYCVILPNERKQDWLSPTKAKLPTHEGSWRRDMTQRQNHVLFTQRDIAFLQHLIPSTCPVNFNKLNSVQYVAKIAEKFLLHELKGPYSATPLFLLTYGESDVERNNNPS